MRSNNRPDQSDFGSFNCYLPCKSENVLILARGKDTSAFNFCFANMNNNTFEQITENVQKSKEGPQKVDFEEMRQADRYF